MAEQKQTVEASVRNGRTKDRDYGQTVQETLQKFFYRKTQSRPVILSNIVNV